jgi:multidrug transporter EmrE-like cation transporter
MPETVYLLCAATSATCAILLLRGYRRQRSRLLLWSSLCFVLLALNNILLFIDLIVVPASVDLSLWRGATALAGVSVLLFGLIWESR